MPFKDTPEGTTHYHNDGCGEPAHNDTPQPRTVEQHKTIEEVVKEFKDWYERRNRVTTHYHVAEWIHTALKEAEQRGARKERERIRTKVMDAPLLYGMPEPTVCREDVLKALIEDHGNTETV